MITHSNSIQENVKEYFIKRKIIGVVGSPRKNGNSDIVLKYIMSGARKENVLTEGIYLRDYQFQPCIGCERCRKEKICTGLNDGMSLLYPKIVQSQGLILISPTHNYNVTAWTKAFIDRLYCFYTFDNNRPRGWSSRLANQGRKALVVAICEQESKEDMGFTLEAMRLPLAALGYEIVGELSVFAVFDKGKVSEKKDILERAVKLGAKLAQSLS